MRKADTEKRMLDYDVPLDYGRMMEYLDIFVSRYDFVSVNYIGTSILGHGIPIVKLGKRENAVLYVGSHHAAEWITSAVLMKFINEYSELFRSNRPPFGCDASIFDRSIYIIPMLNPDGVDIAVNGVNEDNILYDRLVKMNNGSRDFKLWKANARGVDLNHNYNSGFAEYKIIEREQGIYGGGPTKYSGENPESEPEVGALCNYLRFNENIKAVLTLHTQGEEIYYSSGGKVLANTENIARYLSRLSGYSLGLPDGTATYGGLTDWVIEELARPSFTLECGKGETPLPLTDLFSIYSSLRELLFRFPECFSR